MLTEGYAIHIVMLIASAGEASQMPCVPNGTKWYIATAMLIAKILRKIFFM
jgi:hypothetical protein